MTLGRSTQRWGWLILAAFLGTYCGLGLQQTALKLAPAGIAQTLLSTSPLFALPLAMVLGEKVSARAVSGALLAVVGVALLVTA
jgi:drug/metabolite transporter (DMT)-like permease